MEKNIFYQMIEDIADLDSGSLTGKESLASDDFLDSLTMLGLIAMLDKQFNQQLTPDEIKSLETVDGLFAKLDQ